MGAAAEQRDEDRVGAVAVRPQLREQRAGRAQAGDVRQHRLRVEDLHAPGRRRRRRSRRPGFPPGPGSRSRTRPRRRGGPPRGPSAAARAGARPGPRGRTRPSASAPRDGGGARPAPSRARRPAPGRTLPSGHGGLVPSATTTSAAAPWMTRPGQRLPHQGGAVRVELGGDQAGVRGGDRWPGRAAGGTCRRGPRTCRASVRRPGVAAFAAAGASGARVERDGRQLAGFVLDGGLAGGDQSRPGCRNPG